MHRGPCANGAAVLDGSMARYVHQCLAVN
uniref:Uncharacterized protein n=1 Tax=Setaria italica TaxID=4555 RepID=K3XS90_SETIT